MLSFLFILWTCIICATCEEIGCDGGTCGPCNWQPCTLNCIGVDKCLDPSPNFQCLDDAECYINCAGESACSGFAQFHGETSAGLEVDCNGEYACAAGTIHCPSGKYCHVYCEGIAACEELTLNCYDSHCSMECVSVIPSYSSPKSCSQATVNIIPTTPDFTCNGPTSSGYCSGGVPAPFTATPTVSPTEPTQNPSVSPTKNPTNNPSDNPTKNPSTNPSSSPSKNPSVSPTKNPSNNPSIPPTKNPSTDPSKNPTNIPSSSPTGYPSTNPSTNPTKNPTNTPTTHNPTSRLNVDIDTPTQSPSSIKSATESTIQSTINTETRTDNKVNKAGFIKNNMTYIIMIVGAVNILVCVIIILLIFIVKYVKITKKNTQNRDNVMLKPEKALSISLSVDEASPVEIFNTGNGDYNTMTKGEFPQLQMVPVHNTKGIGSEEKNDDDNEDMYESSMDTMEDDDNNVLTSGSFPKQTKGNELVDFNHNATEEGSGDDISENDEDDDEQMYMQNKNDATTKGNTGQ